jgi:hypothetical protein
MAKRIKNNTGSDKIIKGQVVAPGAYYTVPADEIGKFGDASLDAEIAAGTVVVNDGTSDLSITVGQKRLLPSYWIGEVFIDDTSKSDGKSLNYDSASDTVKYYTPSIYGNNFVYNEALSNSSTSSSSYVTKLTLTTGTVLAGDYMVEWSFLQGTDKVQSNIFWRIYQDSTTVLSSAEACMAASLPVYDQVGGFAKITLSAGSHTFKIDHKTDGSQSCGSNIKDARLKFYRVG